MEVQVAILFIGVLIVAVALLGYYLLRKKRKNIVGVKEIFQPDYYGQEHKPYLANIRCLHPDKFIRIHVTKSSVNCETTVKKCGICGHYLSKPETDCR